MTRCNGLNDILTVAHRKKKSNKNSVDTQLSCTQLALMWISEGNTLTKKEIKKINRLEKEYERYVCPISQQLMKEPADVCGFFYDRDQIVEWLSKNKSLPIPTVVQQSISGSSGLAAGESIEPSPVSAASSAVAPTAISSAAAASPASPMPLATP